MHRLFGYKIVFTVVSLFCFTMTMKGQQFLSNFSLPQFYFHAAIAHGLLRHNGVEIGKRDFMGAN